MAYKPEDRPLPEELLEDPWFAPITAATTKLEEGDEMSVELRQRKKVSPEMAVSRGDCPTKFCFILSCGGHPIQQKALPAMNLRSHRCLPLCSDHPLLRAI